MFFVEGGPLCSMHGRDWTVERTAPLAGRSEVEALGVLLGVDIATVPE